MDIVRIYSDTDGESRFEDLSLDLAPFSSIRTSDGIVGALAEQSCPVS